MADYKRLLDNILEMYYTETKNVSIIAEKLGVPDQLVEEAIDYELRQSKGAE